MSVNEPIIPNIVGKKFLKPPTRSCLTIIVASDPVSPTIINGFKPYLMARVAYPWFFPPHLWSPEASDQASELLRLTYSEMVPPGQSVPPVSIATPRSYPVTRTSILPARRPGAGLTGSALPANLLGSRSVLGHTN